MNCNEIRPLLSAYYDGEATPEEHSLVGNHLATCADCRHVLAEYRAIGGGMRAIPVPVPPSGLRRDVWRAIEAQQPTRSIAGASPSAGAGTIRRKQREQIPTTSITSKGRNWGRFVPAGLMAAMLLIFVGIMAVRPPDPTAYAATVVDKSPGYSQPVHVQFAKDVNSGDAVKYTSLWRVEGNTEVEVTDVEKSYSGSSRTLTISPKSAWVAGAGYEVRVDAPKIRIPVGSQNYLGSAPITDSFSTAAYTATPTDTPAATATATSTEAPANTPEPTAVARETTVSDTPTDTPQPIATSTNTSVPTEAPTHTPTAGKTTEPSPTPAPKTTQTPAPKASPTPPCSTMPVNGFGKLWKENAGVRAGIGCPLDKEMALLEAADQRFKGGYMFWRGDTRTILVFLGESKGTWQEFTDTWQESDPTPPPGMTPGDLLEPVRGFGKIWRAYPGLRQALGYAVEKEATITGAWQGFQRGNTLWTTDHLIRVMYDNGAWESYPDTNPSPAPVPPVRP